MRKAILLLFAMPLLSGCNAWTRPALSECEMEALKNFGTLRKPNEHGVLWPPHELEFYYLAACMRARGFILEDRPGLGLERIGSGLRAAYMMNADNWKRDYMTWLPKFIRDN